MKRLLHAFAGNSRGNIAITAALSLLPIMGLIGIGIDLGVAFQSKTIFNAAADAAAIAAVKQARDEILVNAGITGSALTDAQTVGRNVFLGNTGKAGSATIPTPTVSVTRSGQTLTATVSYQTSGQTNFGRLFGVTTFNMKGVAASSSVLPDYLKVYVVLDVSSSMGIGATTADQQIVYNATGGCAVACHYTGTTTTARNAGATLRIDVAKNAIIAALNQVKSSGSLSQVAVYTISDKFTNVYAMSSNIDGAISAVSGIDISDSGNDGGTDTTYALNQLNALLSTSGTGQSQSSARGVVMLITDGVQDSDMKYLSNGSWADANNPNFTVFSPCVQSSCQYFSTFGIYMEAFDPSQCSPIKNKGYTLMTLDIAYLIPPSNLQSSSAALNSVFSYVQQYLLSSIQSNMTACATSSAYAFSASTPGEITSAVATMFAATGGEARLTR